MKFVLVISIILNSVVLFAQEKKVRFESSDINFNYKVDYTTIDGRIEGNYISQYFDGTIRAEGKFENNYRIGLWTAYDEKGNIIMQRNYSDPFTFKKVIPSKAKTGPASLFDTSFYSLKYNLDGFIDYSFLAERMVIYEARIWRELKIEANPLLFKNNKLFNCLYNHITDSLNKNFCSSDDKFSKQITQKEIKKLSLDSYSIISFKIKEDTFYDNERCVSETRIIGICPVGIHKLTKDTVDLFWVYYPYARKALATEKLKSKKLDKKIKSFEDLFFFRDFSGEILKQSNVYDRDLKNYCKTPEKLLSEQQRIEIWLIEMEHDVWLGTYPY